MAARTGRTSGRWRVVVMGGARALNEVGEGRGAKGTCVHLGGMEAGASQGTMRSAGMLCRSGRAPACGAKIGRSQARKNHGRTIHLRFCFRSHPCMDLVTVLECSLEQSWMRCPCGPRESGLGIASGQASMGGRAVRACLHGLGDFSKGGWGFVRWRPSARSF